MPRGTRHVLTGVLIESRTGLILRVDGGGEWRLDAGHRARAHLGARVALQGVRVGFDELSVTRIALATQSSAHE